MSVKKLLAGAAAAALLTSPAMAFDVILGNADGLTAGATPTGDEITAFVAVAEEAVFDAPARAGLFELIVRTDLGSRFAEDENYLIDVDLVGGTFARNIIGDDVTDGALPNPPGNGAGVGGTSIRFDGSDPSGEAGETNVGFLSNIATPGRSIGIELPIQLDGCNDLDIIVTINTGGGDNLQPLEQQVFRLEDVVVCLNAFKALVTADTDFENGVSYDSFLTSASEFQRFDDEVATGFGGDDDDDNRATLGRASVNFNPTNTSRPILTDLRFFSDALDGSEAEDLDFDVVLEDQTGIASASVTDEITGSADGTGTSDAFGGNVASVSLDDIDASSDSGLGDTDIAIALVEVNLSDPAAPVENQQVFATNVQLSFEEGEGLEEFDTDEMGMELDDINYEGVRCGEFDWVGDADRVTRNIFRATGYGDDVIAVFATIRNASIGAPTRSAEELTTVTIGATETIITAADLSAAFGTFGRGDVTFNFIGSEGQFSDVEDTDGPNLSIGGLDCDRLQASPVTAIVTPFGNASSPQNIGIDGFVNDGDDNVGFFD